MRVNFLFAGACAFITFAAIAMTVAQTNARPPEPEVILTKLSTPIYPRPAQQARVAGDVGLHLRIRPDGGLESADVVSGPAMLRRAALDSARQSLFECRHCGTITNYLLTYRFAIAPRDPPKRCDVVDHPAPPSPDIDLSRRNITVLAWPTWTCDPIVATVRVRSAKCLYLWKCGRVELQ